MVQLTNPISIRFTNTTHDVRTYNIMTGDPQGFNNIPTIEIPISGTSAQYRTYVDTISKIFNSGKFDYGIISYDPSIARRTPQILHSIDIRMNALRKAAGDNVRLFDRFNDTLYYVNPQPKEGEPYYVPDDKVLGKRNTFTTKEDWEKYQSDVWDKLAPFFPLTKGEFKGQSNHLQELTSAKRGLNERQLDGFLSWKNNMSILPGLINDDLIGMPGFNARIFNDFQLFIGGTPLNSPILNIKTSGQSGFMIPMRNLQGDTPKHQLGVDSSKLTLTLKAKAADGISIRTSEYSSKEGYDRIYHFKLADGRDSNLKIQYADNEKVELSDVSGSFVVNEGQNIIPILKERGYVIPELMDTLKPSKTKYTWLARGTMAGNEKLAREEIIPSKAGFITPVQPPQGSDEYTLIVVEGALKGKIVAEYMNMKDSSGMSLADHLAPGTGVIVAQSPGTAQSFIDSIQDVFPKRNIKQTYIALDADGATNLSVAKGIHYAYDTLGQHATTHVLTWDINKGKGLDDLILGVMNPANQRTFRDIGLDRGTAEQLYPLDKASENIPYSLDGTRSYTGQVDWQEQYELDANNAYIREQVAKGNTSVLGDDILDLLGGQKNNTTPQTPKPSNTTSIFDQVESAAIKDLPKVEKPSHQSLLQQVLQSVKKNKDQDTKIVTEPNPVANPNQSLFDDANNQQTTNMVQNSTDPVANPNQSLFEDSNTQKPIESVPNTSTTQSQSAPVNNPLFGDTSTNNNGISTQPVQQVQQVQQVQEVTPIIQSTQQAPIIQSAVNTSHVTEVKPVQLDEIRKLISDITKQVTSQVVPIAVQQVLEQVTPEMIQKSVENALIDDQSFINAVSSLTQEQHTL